MPYWFLSNSYAELATNDVLNNVLNKYQEAASSWANTIQGYAEYFLSALAVMGFVWQLSQAWFHRSAFAEVIGEIIRYITFCGVFLWLLREGPNLAESIINALRQIGNEASGQPGLNPSGIVDLGFSVFDKACVLLKSDLSIDHVLVFILALIVLIIIALIGVNMLLQLCSAWVLAYAGVIFLGFGGSYWTKDMAVNYFKTVLGIGASLMTMTLLIGIGQNIIQEGVTQMSNGGEILGSEMGVLLVTSITLFMLVDKLPALVAGIINGASIGSAGIGSFGAGAAVGAAAASMGLAATSISKSASIIAGAAKGGAALGQEVPDSLPPTMPPRKASFQTILITSTRAMPRAVSPANPWDSSNHLLQLLLWRKWLVQPPAPHSPRRQKTALAGTSPKRFLEKA